MCSHIDAGTDERVLPVRPERDGGGRPGLPACRHE
ncbi:hypothetical protein SHIRM173S_04456 [Streptomyces hirsutus]